MKRIHTILMCLFWSAVMFAQTGDELNPLKITSKTNSGGVLTEVCYVVWNADDQDLSDVIKAERAFFAPKSFSETIMPIDGYDCYHIAVLRFPKSTLRSGDVFSVDISADLTHSLKPIYFVVAGHNSQSIGVQRINDYTFRLTTDAHNSLLGAGCSKAGSKADSKAGGGVITAVGIMGRAKSLSTDPCLYVNYDNRRTMTANQSYPLQSNSEYICTRIRDYGSCSQDDEHTRVEADATSSVRSYPNPAQDYLFVEAEGLGIQNANILNLQGQSVSHQIAIHYAEDRLKIDVDRLSAGLYILQVETSSGRVAKKIYIQ